MRQLLRGTIIAYALLVLSAAAPAPKYENLFGFYVELARPVAAFLIMIVPLVVFIGLQRYFVQGLLAGSVK